MLLFFYVNNTVFTSFIIKTFLLITWKEVGTLKRVMRTGIGITREH